MRKFFILFAFLASIVSFAQIKWMSLPEALEAQRTQPKKIMIDFYADWCGPCKIMDKKTFAHPVIEEYINQNYYPVKFDAEGAQELSIYGRTFSNPEHSSGKKKNSLHEFTQFMNVNSVPSLVFIDEQAMPITILNGMLTAVELEPYLSLISTNGYQKIKSRQEWDDYQKKFKSRIKN